MFKLPWQKQKVSSPKSWPGRPVKPEPINRANIRPKFNIFTKLKERMPGRTELTPSMQMGAKLREERAKQRREVVLNKVSIDGRKYLRLGLLGLIILVVIAVLGGVAYYLHREQVYILKNITVEGNSAISELEIVSELADLKDKSLITFSSSDIENRLKAKFPYIKDVFARKLLPGQLVVQIKERFPTNAYVNLSGSYLIDDDRVVVGIITSEAATALTANEILIFDGYGDINANYVFEQYLTKISSDAEKSKVVWDQVPESAKRQALSELKAALQTRIDTAFRAHEQSVTQAGWSTLRLMEGSDASDFKTGDRFPESKFELVANVAKYMAEQELPVSKYLWQSDFSLLVQLSNNQQILFTTTKDLNRQLVALEAVRNKGDLERASVVDLRSELVAVR